MVKVFDKIPYRIQVAEAPWPCLKCIECGKELGSPNLVIEYEKGKGFVYFCFKCARPKLETIVGLLQFFSSETKLLLAQFPKKAKDKQDSIESGIVSGL